MCCRMVSDADIIVPGIERPVLTRGPLCSIYLMITRVVPCVAGWLSDADIIVPGIERPVLTRGPLCSIYLTDYKSGAMCCRMGF